MSTSVLAKDKRYTYDDYLTWDNETRCELIDGVIYMLSAPAWEHQDVGGAIFKQLANFLTGKSCKVFYAPFDVRLNADEGNDTVVQPDIVIICDRSKLIGTGCVGTPDMVVEILSPSTSTMDRVVKFNKYLQFGVREYWIVDLESKSVSAHVLENGKYTTSAYGVADTPPVHILDGCQINLSEVFAGL